MIQKEKRKKSFELLMYLWVLICALSFGLPAHECLIQCLDELWGENIILICILLLLLPCWWIVITYFVLDFQNVLWTPSRLIARLGKEINNNSSYLYWAYKASAHNFIFWVQALFPILSCFLVNFVVVVVFIIYFPPIFLIFIFNIGQCFSLFNM